MVELPSEFVGMLRSMPGHEELPEVLATTESPTSIRLNPHKLAIHGLDASAQISVPWEPQGLYFDRRPAFTFHPALHDGRFYVQDASSMIIGEVIRRITKDTDGPLTYLDACAAPGGKTTSALANLPEGSLVVANEYESSRVDALVDNVERWGIPGAVITAGDATRLRTLGPIFDIVAADVPCSGEGMMRKNSTAVSQWSPKLIEECARLQRDIVGAVWQTLKPGGYLVYSTCTFNTIENEGNATWIRDELGAIPIDLGLTESYSQLLAGINTDVPCVRLLPGRVRGEGQFMAVFRKPEDDTTLRIKNRSIRNEKLPLGLKSNGYTTITTSKGNVYAVDKRHINLVSHIVEKARVVVPGVHVAVPKGRDLMPAPALATSLLLSDNLYPRAAVDYATAMTYLRGEALRLPGEIKRGYVLIEHDGYRLGWVNNIGNRANNLLPTGRRIRSGQVPETCPELG